MGLIELAQSGSNAIRSLRAAGHDRAVFVALDLLNASAAAAHSISVLVARLESLVRSQWPLPRNRTDLSMLHPC
jgi:hypothetical protein